MYSVGKLKQKGKDVVTVGPQLALQATATSVNERPSGTKQIFSAGRVDDKFRKDIPVSGVVYGSNNSTSRSAQQHNDNTLPETIPRASTAPRRLMQTLPTAYVQDLTTNHVDENRSILLNSQAFPGGKIAVKAPSSASRLGGGITIAGSSVISEAEGDRVMFTESPLHPGIQIVYRTPEERQSNPERLNLDRRRLSACPMLENEDQLRLLNYQHNSITKIQNVSRLRRLIFLDMYDNHVEAVSGIETLRSLRVLMLGKNRIRRIENLSELIKLDVLDLHGNQIQVIESLNHLTELRVLNLAGNQIKHVNNLKGMNALQELNLRRNQISIVNDIDNLPNMQRLFLSLNQISSYDDIACLGDSMSLLELTLDGNPISQDTHYKQNILKNIHHLKSLDNKKLTEEERRLAMIMARKDIEKKKETNKVAALKERRMVAINNAKRQWEIMQGTLMAKTSSQVSSIKEIHATCVANVPNEEVETNHQLKYSRTSSIRPASAKSNIENAQNVNGVGVLGNRPSGRPASSNANRPNSRTSISIDHLAEVDQENLTLIGAKALDALDKNMGVQAAGAITTIIFKFIEFDCITKLLGKLRARYPSVTSLVFTAANIKHLAQLNALAILRRLDAITIETESNPITQFVLWRAYLLFRLAHLNLRRINDMEVTPTDIVNAEKYFSMLSNMTTTQLSHSRLLSLIGDPRRKHFSYTADEKSRLETVKQIDKQHPGESVSRAALTYITQDVVRSKSKACNTRKRLVRSLVAELTVQAVNIHQKQMALEQILPGIVKEMIQKIVIEVAPDVQAYTKKQLSEVEGQ